MSLSTEHGEDRFHRLKAEKRLVFRRNQGSGKDTDCHGYKRNLSTDGNVINTYIIIVGAVT